MTKTTPFRPIQVEDWKKAYTKGASDKATKWKDNFLSTSGIAAAAASNEAQAAYVKAVTNTDIQALRQKRLAKLSDADFKGPVEKGGASLYSSGTSAKADKAASRVAPFLAELNSYVPTLPARTDNIDTNVDTRVKTIDHRLHDLKLKGS